MEFPIIIKVDTLNILGILRVPSHFTKMVVLIPSFTGNRLGPQRLFVEMARALYDKNIASFCVDLPELDYSSGKDPYKEIIVEFNDARYSFYLKRIVDYLKTNYTIGELLLLSISFGCMPIFNFARRNTISRLILLSPDQVTSMPVKINTKNILNYYYKLMDKNSWYKLFTLKLDLKNIVKNIFSFNNKHIRKFLRGNNAQGYVLSKPGILCIYGENDRVWRESHAFFDKQAGDNLIENYDYEVIQGADHSFFGWKFKQDVINKTVKWI